MDVLILTLFVSLVLAVLGVGLFVWSVVRGTNEHTDRLALLPLEQEDAHSEHDRTPTDLTGSAVSDNSGP